MSNKTTLFFGPYPLPLTGQSVAFKEIYDNYNDKKKLCNISKFGTKIYANMLYVLIVIPFIFLFTNIKVVYFTCSRTKFGFIRDFWLIFFSFIFDVKIINHIHGNDFQNFIESFTYFKFIPNWAYSKVNCTILLFEKMKTQLKDFPKTSIKTIANSYSNDFKNININELIISKNPKNFQLVFLSNIMSSKGILLFLDAMETVLEENKNVTVKIAGQLMGDYLMSLDEITQKFYNKYNLLEGNFPDRIEYLGTVSGEKKEKLLKESTIFILPTIHKTEAFPISIIEAMYFGNIVITSNINYLGDIVSEKNGIIISNIDSKKITNSVLELLNNPNKIKSIMEYNYYEARSRYNPRLYIESIKKTINEYL